MFFEYTKIRFIEKKFLAHLSFPSFSYEILLRIQSGDNF
jgi:hypothetical protein